MTVPPRIVAWGIVVACLIAIAGPPGLGRAADDSVIGQDAKPFTLRTVEGERVGLADLVGKGSILLVFISVSCFECDDMMPTVSKLMDEYEKSEGLRVLFVALANEKGTKWLAKSGKYDKRAPLLIEAMSGANLPTADGYGVVATPSLVLIGQDGKIRWTQTGRVSLETLAGEVRRSLERPR